MGIFAGRRRRRIPAPVAGGSRGLGGSLAPPFRAPGRRNRPFLTVDRNGPSKTQAARSSSCAFQSVIWFGWMSYCCASSADVRSPFIAANATCALNAGEWFRRFLLAMPLLSFETAYAVGRESKAKTFPPSNFFRPALSFVFRRHHSRGQLFFAPCATHFFSKSIFSLGMDSLPCGIFMEGSARPSTSMIMTLLRLSPGLMMLPNLVPFIRLS